MYNICIMTDKDTEIARLRSALKKSKNEIKSLKNKLETSKAKVDKAHKELKTLKKKHSSAPLIKEEVLEEFVSTLEGIISPKR